MLATLTYKTVTLTGVTASPAAVQAALAALTSLAPQPDTLGNVQAVFRLDYDTDGVTLIATVPDSVADLTVTDAADGAEAAAQAAAAAYAAAPATAADHAVASAQIITDKLAAVPVPRDKVSVILQSLLGEASKAIPFFEQYALDPSMTAQQWVDFQALNQTTKDRLLYDVVRSLAALMRYLSGDLPVT